VTINGIGERAGNASLEEVSSCTLQISLIGIAKEYEFVHA
jgi:isopropylmalate/homocitrate/citramalate synthase